MNQRPIMDAGPGINFFSIHKERLLFSTLGALAIPETVEQEIRRKSREEERFRAAERVLSKVPASLLEVLSDDTTPELTQAVSRISRMPARDRFRSSKDLGELMVIAHESVAAEGGQQVLVLIDDRAGRVLASAEAARLQRLIVQGADVGSIGLLSTVGVLRKAAGLEHIRDRNAMRDIYGRLRTLDDGLPPIQDTGLLKLPCWK